MAKLCTWGRSFFAALIAAAFLSLLTWAFSPQVASADVVESTDVPNTNQISLTIESDEAPEGYEMQFVVQRTNYYRFSTKTYTLKVGHTYLVDIPMSNGRGDYRYTGRNGNGGDTSRNIITLADGAYVANLVSWDYVNVASISGSTTMNPDCEPGYAKVKVVSNKKAGLLSVKNNSAAGLPSATYEITTSKEQEVVHVPISTLPNVNVVTGYAESVAASTTWSLEDLGLDPDNDEIVEVRAYWDSYDNGVWSEQTNYNVGSTTANFYIIRGATTDGSSVTYTRNSSSNTGAAICATRTQLRIVYKHKDNTPIERVTKVTVAPGKEAALPEAGAYSYTINESVPLGYEEVQSSMGTTRNGYTPNGISEVTEQFEYQKIPTGPFKFTNSVTGGYRSGEQAYTWDFKFRIVKDNVSTSAFDYSIYAEDGTIVKLNNHSDDGVITLARNQYLVINEVPVNSYIYYEQKTFYEDWNSTLLEGQESYVLQDGEWGVETGVSISKSRFNAFTLVNSCPDDADQEFTFNMRIGSAQPLNAIITRVDGSSETKILNDGSKASCFAQFKLKSGDQMQIVASDVSNWESIELGTQFIIQEVYNGDYNTNYQINSDAIVERRVVNTTATRDYYNSGMGMMSVYFNNNKKEGQLWVTKYDGDSTVNPDEEFEMTLKVDGGNAWSYEYEIYESDGTTDGQVYWTGSLGEFTLKNGQTARFSFKTGSTYEINENLLTDEYIEPAIADGTGTISYTGIKKCVVTNALKRSTLQITKSATRATDSDSFTFNLKIGDAGAEVPFSGNYVITGPTHAADAHTLGNMGANNTVYGELKTTDNGVISGVKAGDVVTVELLNGSSYVVSEEPLADFDSNPSGEVSGTVSPGVANETVAFTNTKHDPTPTTVALSAQKKFTLPNGAEQAIAQGQFNFELKDDAGNTLDTKSCDASGLVTFDAQTITAAGIYYFSIQEIEGQDESVKEWESSEVSVEVNASVNDTTNSIQIDSINYAGADSLDDGSKAVITNIKNSELRVACSGDGSSTLDSWAYGKSIADWTPKSGAKASSVKVLVYENGKDKDATQTLNVGINEDGTFDISNLLAAFPLAKITGSANDAVQLDLGELSCDAEVQVAFEAEDPDPTPKPDPDNPTNDGDDNGTTTTGELPNTGDPLPTIMFTCGALFAVLLFLRYLLHDRE